MATRLDFLMFPNLNHLDVKIIIFHHNQSVKKLELFQSRDPLHHTTGCIYMTTIIVLLQIRQDSLHHLMFVSTVTNHTVRFYCIGVHTTAMYVCQTAAADQAKL